jgi:hypothetical protein
MKMRTAVLFLTVSAVMQAGPILFVPSNGSNYLNVYNGSTGAYVGDTAVSNPVDIAVGPNGNVYVTDGSIGSVIEYSGTTGASLGTFVSAGSGGLLNGAGADFRPQRESLRGERQPVQ